MPGPATSHQAKSGTVPTEEARCHALVPELSTQQLQALLWQAKAHFKPDFRTRRMLIFDGGLVCLGVRCMPLESVTRL